jgi:hypothetical protein
MKNYIKLTKVRGQSWNGNGMGTDTAEWVVKGAEHIAVLKVADRWIARDDSVRKEHGISRIIARSDYKRDLINKLNLIYMTESITAI